MPGQAFLKLSVQQPTKLPYIYDMCTNNFTTLYRNLKIVMYYIIVSKILSVLSTIERLLKLHVQNLIVDKTN